MSSPSGADKSGKTRSNPTSPATELPGPIRLLQRRHHTDLGYSFDYGESRQGRIVGVVDQPQRNSRQRVAAIDEDDALHLLSLGGNLRLVFEILVDEAGELVILGQKKGGRADGSKISVEKPQADIRRLSLLRPAPAC